MTNSNTAIPSWLDNQALAHYNYVNVVPVQGGETQRIEVDDMSIFNDHLTAITPERKALSWQLHPSLGQPNMLYGGTIAWDSSPRVTVSHGMALVSISIA